MAVRHAWLISTLFLLEFTMLFGPLNGQVRQMNLQEMTKEATAIVIGECLAQESRWVGKQIHSFIKIEIHETLKGSIANEVVVTVPGGRVREPWPIEMRVSHAPRFEVGEEVLLFLWRSPKGSQLVLGLSQGKFSISRDGGTGEKLVDRYPGSDLEPADTQETSTRVKATKPSLTKLTNEILAYVKQ